VGPTPHSLEAECGEDDPKKEHSEPEGPRVALFQNDYQPDQDEGNLPGDQIAAGGPEIPGLAF
jgi:hypothetical protein